MTGFFKIKYREIGIRIVYAIVRDNEVMNIVVISIRSDNHSYKLARKRKDKYGEDINEDIF